MMKSDYLFAKYFLYKTNLENVSNFQQKPNQIITYIQRFSILNVVSFVAIYIQTCNITFYINFDRKTFNCIFNIMQRSSSWIIEKINFEFQKWGASCTRQILLMGLFSRMNPISEKQGSTRTDIHMCQGPRSSDKVIKTI